MRAEGQQIKLEQPWLAVRDRFAAPRKRYLSESHQSHAGRIRANRRN